MLKKLCLFSIGLLLFIVLVSCKTDSTSNGDTTTVPQDNNTTVDQGTEQLVSLSKADLAQRLKIAQSEIKLISVQEVLFSDTSLGVPEPGKFYAEVITPGYIIKLEANQEVYQYNTDKEDRVVLYLEEITFPIQPGEIDDGKPWVPVD